MAQWDDFNNLLYGSTNISHDDKVNISNLAKNANNAQGIQALHQGIYGSGLDQSLKDQLAGMYQYNTGGGNTQSQSGGGSQGGGTGGGGGQGGGGGARDLLWDVGRAGMNIPNDPAYRSISDYLGRLFGGNAADPWGGTNPVLQGLAGKLGQISPDDANNYIHQLMGGGNQWGMWNPAGGSFGAPAPGSGFAGAGGAGGGGGSYGGGGGGGSWNASAQSGGMPPDTMAQNSFFANQMKAFFDPSRLDPASDPTMQPYLDAMRNEMMEGWKQQMGTLSAGAEGAGRFGSSFYKSMIGRAQDETMENYANQMAQQLFGARQNALEQQMQGLGLVNQRDLGSLDANVALSGQRSAANSAAAAANAQLEAARLAADVNMRGQDLDAYLGGRGQDLQAILGMMGGNNELMGLLGGIGQGLSSQQMQGLGNYADLLNLQMGGWDRTLGAAGTIGQLDAADAARRQAAAQWEWQRGWQDMFNQNQLLADYLNLLGGIGGMGGTQYGYNYMPGGNIDPNIAALLGGVGGITTGAGLYGQMGR